MAATHAPEHTTNEETPLLGSPSVHDVSEPENTRKSGRRSEAFIVAILMLAILTVSTGDELIQPAQTRVFEAIYCRQYYAEHDPSLIGSDGGDGVAERYCKNHVIQGDVAMLRGWLITIEAFVMLLVSVPWGYAADVYGRKPILVILMLGLLFRAAWIQAVCWFWRTLPIKAIWGAAGFALMGGGNAVIIAMVFTLVADVIPEARRASMFFQIAGASMASQVVGPFASAALMRNHSPWIPMLLGLGLQVLVVLQALILPETKDYLVEQSQVSSDTASDTSSTYSSKCTPWTNIKRAMEDSITFLAADLRLLLLIPAFLMHMLVMNKDVLLQYVSTRYSLSLANATFILTLRSGWILALMFIMYPALNHFLRTKLGMHPQRMDLYLARACVIITGFGFLLIAWATSVPLLITSMAINTLGSGFHLYLRSLATSFVEQHHVARLMTFMSWIDTIGLMIGAPLIAWLFERGIDIGGLCMGLPFLFCAVMYAIIAVLIGMISLGEPQPAQEVEEAEPLVGSEEDRT